MLKIDKMKLNQIKNIIQKAINEVQIKKPANHSMSNADIGALQQALENNPLSAVLNTLAVLVDQNGLMQEAQMISDLVAELPEKETDNDEPFADRFKRHHDTEKWLDARSSD